MNKEQYRITDTAYYTMVLDHIAADLKRRGFPKNLYIDISVCADGGLLLSYGEKDSLLPVAEGRTSVVFENALEASDVEVARDILGAALMNYVDAVARGEEREVMTPEMKDILCTDEVKEFLEQYKEC